MKSRTLFAALVLLLLAAAAFAQNGMINAQPPVVTGAIIAADTVVGPVQSNGYGVASVTLNGTYGAVSAVFEFSDDAAACSAATHWYPVLGARSDVASVQEGGFTLLTNTTRSWNVSVYGSTCFRVRATAWTSGSAAVGITLSAAPIEAAPTVSIAQGAGNPCANPSSTLQAVLISTSGTSAVEIVALAAGKSVYLCSLNVVGVSGTTPTFSLVTGTGTNCGTGQAVYLGAWTTAANTIYPFQGPLPPAPSGKALCYLDTGTTPVQRVTLSYVQQ